MDLTLHRSPTNGVHRIDHREVQIGEHTYRRSLLVDAERVDDTWPVVAADELNRTHAQALLEWKPAVVIIGTGSRLTFPPAEFGAALMSAGVGLEAMDSAAAARTYNVLLDEGRAALLGLIYSP